MTRFVLLPVLMFTACAGFGHQQAPATPQRPTLSTDTTTTAVDTVELEAGVAIDPGDSFTTPTVTKWGATERTEVFVGLTPWIWIDNPGGDREGPSDLSIGVRHRFADQSGELPSAAFQLTAKLPTANDEIGTGEHDFLAAGILTKTYEDLTLTGFYQLGLLGDPNGRGVELGHDAAVAAAYRLDDRFGLFGELAGQFVPDRDTDVVYFTGGVTFAETPEMVFDAGLLLGLDDEAPDVVLLFGCTWNLGKVFARPGE